jgi:hypothetical protein
MKLDDSMVETPVPLVEIGDRSIYVGSEYESQCSSCGTTKNDPWYPVEDVMVIRHWTTNGGIAWWYCPDHFNRRTDRWWRNSDLAPTHLLPEITHQCERPGVLGSTCGDEASVAISGIWTCERHAEAARVDRRIAELMADEPLEEEL